MQDGQQKHPGWGFFLIQKYDNDPQASDLASHYVIELFL